MESQREGLLTGSMLLCGRMAAFSSCLPAPPRSVLFLSSSRLFLLGLLSSLCTCRSTLAAPPVLSLRTGLVSHFLSVLTERRELGELGAELLEGCGWMEATEVEILPSLPATE